jgi:hypothetical protein
MIAGVFFPRPEGRGNIFGYLFATSFSSWTTISEKLRGEVAGAVRFGFAPAARLRRAGSRTLERTPRTIPPTLRRSEYASRKCNDTRTILSRVATTNATGSLKVHQAEQDALVKAAVTF